MMKASITIATLAALSGAASGQTSPLYMSRYADNICYVVQGGSIINSFRFADSSIQTLVVDSTVRTVSYNPGSPGRQYDLAGNPLGPTYTNPGIGLLFDATTDGTNYNYAVGYTGTTLYRTNLDWTGQTAMFGISSSGGTLGTAYDLTDNTIWISDGGGSGSITHYDLTGAVLGSFTTSSSFFALALDPADGTLWLRQDGSSSPWLQYDKAGNLLQTMDTSALGLSNVVGWEFAAIPAPGSLVLLGLGGLAAARRRRA